MKLLVNFADASFRASQRINSASALEQGGFDHVLSFGPRHIDKRFAFEYRRTFSHRRGAGLWLWKPYFVREALRTAGEGDYVFYCDSGATFVASIDPLIAVAERDNLDIVCFELAMPEAHWTKRDAFLLMDCDRARYAHTPQRLASFFLLRNGPSARQLIEQYLEFATDSRILGDDENVLREPNYAGFVAHRHDQSIFSLLTKRYGVPAHRDPSQWGNGAQRQFPNSNYGQIIDHTRKRSHSVVSLLACDLERFAMHASARKYVREIDSRYS